MQESESTISIIRKSINPRYSYNLYTLMTFIYQLDARIKYARISSWKYLNLNYNVEWPLKIVFTSNVMQKLVLVTRYSLY